MKEGQTDRKKIALIIGAAIVAAGIAAFLILRPKAPEFSHAHLRCAIELRSKSDTTKGFLAGYTYYLLEKYAESNGITADIELVSDVESAMDSLRSGALDILSIPFRDSLTVDSLYVSEPLDSLYLWLVPSGEEGLASNMDSWIRGRRSNPAADSIRTVFLDTYTPEKRAKSGKKYSYVSPYDSLFKACADTLGWDWRMVAAIAYQESKFHIEARSRRGAAGLMQMMPSTAHKFLNEGADPVDPKESMKAGAEYLTKLYHRYRRFNDKNERIKLTLAAYNAGEGRIRAVLNYAGAKGLDVNKWDEIASVIPLIKDDESGTADSLNIGKFKGNETIAYVDRVLKLCQAFREICPED